MARELAVVLANGSIQSAVACALAAQKHRPIMIYAETGTNSGRAGQAFDAMVQHFKPYRSHRVAMPFMAGGAKSETNATQADTRSGQHTTALLVDLMPIVATALRFGVHYGAVALYAGIRVGADSSDLARVTEYGQIWAEMVQMPCERPEFEVVMPLLELDPWQVIDLGVQVNAPLQLAWSCEKLVGDACGECRGCRERDAAFQRAGRPDPAKVSTRAAG